MRATFFVRGMAAQGHEVGNHTYHHVRLPGLCADQVRFALTQANRVTMGRPLRSFHPPDGNSSPLTLRIAGQERLVTPSRTDDPGDFDHPGDAVVAAQPGRHLRRGDIVLPHDDAPEAIDVLPAFLRAARARGMQFPTVGDLARE